MLSRKSLLAWILTTRWIFWLLVSDWLTLAIAAEDQRYQTVFGNQTLLPDPSETFASSLGLCCTPFHVQKMIFTLSSTVVDYQSYWLLNTRQITSLKEARRIHVAEMKVLELFPTLNNFAKKRWLANSLAYFQDLYNTCCACESKIVLVFQIYYLMVLWNCTSGTPLLEWVPTIESSKTDD